MWREKQDDPIGVYQFQVFPFGNPSSGTVAIFVLKERARELKEQFPRAAQTITDSSLVDDILDSFETEQEAIGTIKGLVKISQDCDMKMRKFASNSKKVLETVPEEDKGKSRNITGLAVGDQFITKALGVILLFDEDVFTFKMDAPEVKDDQWTKRLLCGTHARLFDPLGLISPFTIVARMLLQQCWREDVNWDEPVPKSINQRWLNWIKSLPDLQNIRIERCLKGVQFRGRTPIRQEIHAFADASGKAYAAIVFVKTVFDNDVFVSIALAKARVVPIQFKSIPRLELMACELATELVRTVNRVYCLSKKELYFWTDSMNAICWIKSETKMLKVFAANRVSKILAESLRENWHWTSTDQNPADLATRGQTASQLVDNDLWKRGPEFLSKDKESWPVLPALEKNPTVLNEMKKEAKIHSMLGIEKNEELPPNHPQRFSSLKEVLNRNTKYIYFFRVILKGEKGPKNHRDPVIRELTLKALVPGRKEKVSRTRLIKLKKDNWTSQVP